MRKLWPLASILCAFVVMLLPRLQPDIAPVLHSENGVDRVLLEKLLQKMGPQGNLVMASIHWSINPSHDDTIGLVSSR